MNLFSILLFTFSVFLLFWVAVVITKLYAKNMRDAFWIMAGTLYLQISSIPLFLSIFHLLNSYGFLACQIFLVSLVFVFSRHKRNFEFTFNHARLTIGNVEKSLFVLATLLIALSLAQRIFTPLSSGDVLYYHASRLLYWIQNSSMAPYPTMNDRQIVFAFGSDLIFMWPVLFTKSEFIGRVIYWFGFPAAATGFYTVLRTMHCSKRLSLLGVIAFLSLPIVFNFSLNLQPLVWVSFFALGAGYWALRVAQTSARNSLFIFWLGVYCVLPGNAKNNGVVLIFAGAVAVLLVTLFQNNGMKRFRAILKSLKAYVFAIFIGMLISGLGFLLVQNMILYGNFLASDLRKDQLIAEFSPYQIYVHTIRIGAVLAEIPMPFSNQALEKSGNRIIDLLGANKFLSREKESGWIGHYTYRVQKWPGNSNFGIAGLFILLTFAITIVSIMKIVAKRGLSNLWESLKKSEKLPYAVVAFALFLLTAYLLRWITTGTRSFIAPGIVGVLPLALSFLNRKQIPKKVYLVVFASFLIFALLFAIYQGNNLIKRAKGIGFDWSKIAYSQRYKDRDRIIDKYVPENATILLLVHSNFKDYSMFGRHYTRQVIQYTGPRTKESIYKLSKQYPGAFMYVNTSSSNKEVLRFLDDIAFIEELAVGKLIYREGKIVELSHISKIDNLIQNGDFENWHKKVTKNRYFDSKFEDLVPDGKWLPGGRSPFTISREITNVKSGKYSFKLKSNSSAGTWQGLHLSLPVEEYRGKSLILMSWVKSTTNKAGIHIYDRTQLVKATHSGNNSWELLTLEINVSKSASIVDVSLNLNQVDGTSYFDSVYLVEGDLVELKGARLFKIKSMQDIQGSEA